MKFKIRRIVGWFVAMGYVFMGRRRLALSNYRKPGNVLSLFSHAPTPEVLDGVLGFLKKNGFTFVSTDELLAMGRGVEPWRPLCAWLTFDDGWLVMEEHLLPILEKYDCPATIFVAPNETIRGRIWTNSVMRVKADWRNLYDLSAGERYKIVDGTPGADSNRTLLDEASVIRLSRHRLITIEGHTLTHLSCSHRPPEEVRQESVEAMLMLEEWCGRRPTMMCYPFGHYSTGSDKALSDVGLISVTSDPGVMTIHAIGRVRNMFTEVMTTAENVGRVLQAWPSVRTAHR